MAPATADLGPMVNDPADKEDAGPRHALDLPQLYSKPPAQSLLDAISLLAVPPPSWSGESNPASVDEEGIPSYLTRIISSPLTWIPSDTDKERIWEAASKRLAERSGRTALPSVSRTFSIPVGTQPPIETIDIKLHEPSLTDDNLGHKTWVASYLLAKKLPTLLPRHFPNIEPTSSFSHNPLQNANPTIRILELGAGTGLVGIAASSLFPTTTHLTDLPAILPNLTHNIAQNAHLTSLSAVTAGALDWADYDPRSSPNNSHDHDHDLDDEDGSNETTKDNHNHHNSNEEKEKEDEENNTSPKYDLILAADSIYHPTHPLLLTNTISALLNRDNNNTNNNNKTTTSAKAIICLPFRKRQAEGQSESERETRSEHEHEELRIRMRERGFAVLEEGEEEGWDDWVDVRDRERMVVRCWWAVWGWGDG